MSGHTPGLLQITPESQFIVRDANGEMVADFGMFCETDDGRQFDETNKPNAKRAVSCWNACEGLADPSVVPELLGLAEKLAQAYVIVCDDAGKPYYQSSASVYAALMSIVARAKGGAA